MRKTGVAGIAVLAIVMLAALLSLAWLPHNVAAIDIAQRLASASAKPT